MGLKRLFKGRECGGETNRVGQLWRSTGAEHESW